MSIIGSIRKFFRLDKVTLSLDNEFIDATGLWIHEKNEIGRASCRERVLTDV